MDLLEVLRQDIDGLADGPYLRGLKSVVRHVEAAEGHLHRGRTQPDDAAFTDAIYRCNQAFEGSIKEAYRVLAGKEPGKTNIYTVENYLERHRIIRDRVLSQLRNYRTEWRNPSTHDYNLDFDENEALLAVVSVTAFAKLLVDLIEEKLTFLEVKEELEVHPPEESGRQRTLHGQVADHVLRFSAQYLLPDAPRLENEAQINGALHAYLTTALPDVRVQVEALLGNRAGRHRADFVLERDGDRVILEVKRGYRKELLDQSINQVEHYLLLADAKSGVILFAEPGPSFVTSGGTSDGKEITIISPEQE